MTAHDGWMKAMRWPGHWACLLLAGVGCTGGDVERPAGMGEGTSGGGASFGSSGASLDEGSDDETGGGETGDAGSDGNETGSDTGDDDTEVVPLFDETTVLEPEVHFDRGDAIVTRLSDRGRDRHAREDQFQSYDHYLPLYWEHRTARMQLVDTVAKGGTTIDVSFVTEWPLGPIEFRAWYSGLHTVAQYGGNYGFLFTEEGPGTFDNEHQPVSDEGTQYKYTYTIDSAITLDGQVVPLAEGQFMEFENSMFLDAPPQGRANYYGTTFLYEVGRGGMVPWYTVGEFEDPGSERENSHPLDEAAWLGGRTTLPHMYSEEPDNHFMQMATNLSSVNGQAFMRGRRVHHTDMVTGAHDESPDNGTFDELAGLAGPNYVNASCDGCHHRNGRAPVAAPGEPLDRWVFKVAAEDGSPDPAVGAVLQPHATDGGPGEGDVTLAEWVEDGEGLRSPVYAFSQDRPARFSARLAPPLVGMGLIEAIAESTVLAWADPDDADGDGISGRVQVVPDPVTAEPRMGRFGWKAGAGSLPHQVAAALNTDMGVMTSIFDTPDCGAAQTGCGNAQGPELADEHLDELVKYVALLGVRARRSIDDPQALAGEQLFSELGCGDCHRADIITSPYHPFAELRSQVIHPYTDLLLHDMGEGLADDLWEGLASGAEWRTTPLWGLGLGACVTGGVEGPFQDQVCTPHESYLHDGRARTIDEAIRWHGGEAEAAAQGYEALPEDQRQALLRFLESL
ncbi:MAG: di-heme oxidoredictase family protein [Myxococcota bacterium]